MAERSGISWTDSTFNPWIGCTKVSPGCDHCYAERDFDLRRHVVTWGAGQERKRTSAANWKKPLQWNAKRFMECGECGWRGECAAELIGCGSCGSSASMNDARRRVFCASLADVFDNEVDPQWRADLMELIVKTPTLDWLLLTKRIGNVERMVEEAGDLIDYGEGWQSLWGQGEWPENVWLGATIVNQPEADRDIARLLAIRARVHWLSMEPLLGPVSLRNVRMGLDSALHRAWGLSPHHDHIDALHRASRKRIDWVVVGGESGPKARPMHPQWARDLRDQCAAAGVPFHFKQWGEHTEATLSNVDCATADRFVELDGTDSTDWTIDRHDATTAHMVRIGKKAAGRLLDGRTHDEYPEVSHGV